MIKSVKLTVTMEDGTQAVAELENITDFQEKFVVPTGSPVIGGMPARRRFVIEGTRPRAAAKE